MDAERVELTQPRYGTVNVYRVGDTLVDTGHPCQESRDRLRRELDGGRLDGVERVVLTHPHVDHVGGALTVDPLGDLPHVVFEGADGIVTRYGEYLAEARAEMAAFAAGPDHDPVPDDEYFPPDRNYDAPRIARVVGPGDTVAVGPHGCRVVHTPGHSAQHMALLDEASGVALSGDILSTNGHFMYGPLHWSVADYRTGLRRLREASPDRLLPGHGPPVEDPAGRVADALAKADAVEEAVLAAVEERGPLSGRELAVEALGAGPDTAPFLATVASVFAVHLAERGKLAVERRPYVVARPA